MFRSTLHVSLRRNLPSRHIQNYYPRKFIHSKDTARKSRAWKSVALRWALLVGGMYYYNTHDLLAEAPEAIIDDEKLGETNHNISQLTVNAIVEQRRKQQALSLAEQQSIAKLLRPEDHQIQDNVVESPNLDDEKESSEVESEVSQEGAFDPETGTINWDCPCLGGMAHGPCGEEFKAAFSCFVYSKEEPKGVECIDKFKTMQNCFRQYPEIYGAELEDESSEQDGVEEVIGENTKKTSQTSEQLAESNPLVTSHAVDTNPISSPELKVDNQRIDITNNGNNEPDAKLPNIEST
ncbi:Mitochondrial intermembrane space import and assembly protein 40 [Erysiphe neolycopersici]|uniref:Mitochondrial intermembrane space import and assembly protein 40 n=1 Tax=Erysiphe neolycopersici TaxID=212602 RepID=A0A420HZ32_9PEZI|nr:Mitochondrial intermembrane space import and assembly protein 40 [Erysiphe neolycopersici]